MLATERPRLRPYLHLARAPGEMGSEYLVDRLGLADEPHRLTAQEAAWLGLLDGHHTLRDIQLAAMARAGGRLLPIEQIARWVDRLDAGLFLDSPAFRRVVDAPVRAPRHVGCYERDPADLRRQLDGLFTHPDGPGRPGPPRPDGALRAALLPHIDYHRGGVSYAWGFREVFERTDASLFVIVGTSHYCANRFTLTRKHFETPLGVVETDPRFIDRLTRHHGGDLFADEWLAHFPEHSIELEVVFLQYLYEKVRPIRIVPLVVGSFHDCVQHGGLPGACDDIGRLVRALRQAEAETAEPVCYLISGDLAHIGPKFNPHEPLTDALLRHSKHQDLALIRHAEAADPAGYFRVIAAEADARNICGLPPTYAVLDAVRPRRGRLLHYDRYVHPAGYESVSFASMAFERQHPPLDGMNDILSQRCHPRLRGRRRVLPPTRAE
jgi:AmmeMemoRadiSam system protein B